jgi:site-specific DNA recombinase
MAAKNSLIMFRQFVPIPPSVDNGDRDYAAETTCSDCAIRRRVVIMKLDRLTRSLRDWSDLIDRFFSDKAGRRLFSMNDSIDTRTPSGRMVLNMIMTVAQWEREETAYRTANALQGKIARGERCGRVRFGYVLAADGKTLIPDPVEQRAIEFMKRWKAQGKTYRDTVAQLEELGVETKTPGAVWRLGAIHRILGRSIA